jgi:hypothetical protein
MNSSDDDDIVFDKAIPIDNGEDLTEEDDNEENENLLVQFDDDFEETDDSYGSTNEDWSDR